MFFSVYFLLGWRAVSWSWDGEGSYWCLYPGWTVAKSQEMCCRNGPQVRKLCFTLTYLLAILLILKNVSRRTRYRCGYITMNLWEVFSITQVLFTAGRVYEHQWSCWVIRFSFIHYFRYEQYVEDAYVAFLKQKGQAEQVQNSMKNSFRSQA